MLFLKSIEPPHSAHKETKSKVSPGIPLSGVCLSVSFALAESTELSTVLNLSSGVTLDSQRTKLRRTHLPVKEDSHSVRASCTQQKWSVRQ